MNVQAEMASDLLEYVNFDKQSLWGKKSFKLDAASAPN
jgi:alpha-L-arabinofuranosidase